MIDPMLRRAEVEQETGLSRTSIYRMIARGDFPRPLKVGRRAVRWPASIIEDWIASRPLTHSSPPKPSQNGKPKGPPTAPTA